MFQRLREFMGPADVGVAQREQPPPRVLYPAESVSLNRAQAPLRVEGDIHPSDPIRYSDWYSIGKPFPFPGMAISFVSSIAEWEEDPPLGFIDKVASDPDIAIARGIQARFGGAVNIDRPPSSAYGTLFATFTGYDYAHLPGIGGP